MASDAPWAEELERRIADLEAVVASQAQLIRSQAELIESQRETIEKLEAKVAGLERQLGQNSGNSGTPPSRDTAAERQRQAEERQRRPQAKGAGAKRRKGKQRGAPGTGLRMSAAPDEVVDHRPARCGGCGAELGDDAPSEFAARQVVDLPEVKPVVSEHRGPRLRMQLPTRHPGGVPRGGEGAGQLRPPRPGGHRLPAGPPAPAHPAGGGGDGRPLRAGGFHRRRRLGLLRGVAPPAGLHRRPGGAAAHPPTPAGRTATAPGRGRPSWPSWRRRSGW